MSLDCINIFDTKTWAMSSDPTVTVEYRPFSGPLTVVGIDEQARTMELVRAYLNRCIVKVTNVNIPIRELGKDAAGKPEWTVTVKHFDEWKRGRDPEVNWADVLPPKEANELWISIAAVSRLSAEARRDS
jgi:hypothetical protein